MGVTRIAHIGFLAQANLATNRLTFKLPLTLDGFDASNRDIGMVNLQEDEVIAFVNPTLDVKGDLLSCEIPNMSSVWPNAVTDRYCPAMAGGFSVHGSAAIAEIAANASGDVIVNTPEATEDDPFLIYSQDPDGVFDTTKNIVMRSYSPHVKYFFLVTGGRTSNSAGGVFIEDAWYRPIHEIKQNMTFRRCFFSEAGRIRIGQGAVTGRADFHSCIWGPQIDLLPDSLELNSSGVDEINLYHCGAYLPVGSQKWIKGLAGDLIRVRNSIIIANARTANPYNTLGDYQDTDFNWTTYDGATGNTAGWDGVNNRLNGNIDDLKLAAANNADPSFFLNPFVMPVAKLSPEVVGAGTTDAAAVTIRENRRDFFGFPRASANDQTQGPNNGETHDGGVVGPGYSDPQPAGIEIGNRIIVTV